MICPCPRSQSVFHRLRSQSFKSILVEHKTQTQMLIYIHTQTKIGRNRFFQVVSMYLCDLMYGKHTYFIHNAGGTELVPCIFDVSKCFHLGFVRQQAQGPRELKQLLLRSLAAVCWDSYHSHVNVNIIFFRLRLQSSIYFTLILFIRGFYCST